MRHQHADTSHLIGLLRLGGQRRGKEPRPSASEERATVYHSIT
jgi:hypothetical protein